jgi:hypothetical protein
VPIDLAAVDWVYVGVLSVFAFLAALIGNLLSLNRVGFGAVLSAALFAVIFIGWTYYPHGLPLPTTLASQKPAASAPAPTPVPAAPVAPQRPRNPVTDITPGTGR